MKNSFLNKSYRFNYPHKNRNEEGVLQLSILHYLKGLGAVVGKTKTLGVQRNGKFCFDPYTFVGKCDLECFHKGVMYGIEVKSPTGKLSDHQKSYRDVFHKPPDRIFIEARSLQDVIDVVK